MVLTFIFFFTFSGVLYFKSQKSDIWPYFFSTNVEYVRQSGGEHFKAGWRVIFLFVKNIVRSCFSSALSLSLSVSLVVYFGAGSQSFVRHFFFCHHQIGPAESYTSKVEWWIMEELHKWNCISSIFPRV